MPWTSAFPSPLHAGLISEASSLVAGKVACLDPGTCPLRAEVTIINTTEATFPLPQHTTQGEGKKERLVSLGSYHLFQVCLCLPGWSSRAGALRV